MQQELSRHLLACADRFAGAGGYELSTVGRLACGDSGFFAKLRAGQGTFMVKTYDQVMQWFSDNWPRGTAWPKGVPRPARSAETAA